MKMIMAVPVAAAGLLVTVLGASPAGAAPAGPASGPQTVSDSSSVTLPNTGAVIQANAWECNTFIDKCSFATSAKALRSGSAYTVSTIKNVATVAAHGISVSISTSPSGTITSNSVRTISWTNYNTWIADISGIADPSWNTVWMSTCSDASGYKSGVKAFASACVGN